MASQGIPHFADIFDNTGRWSSIPWTFPNIRSLRSLCHSQHTLRVNAYVLEPLTHEAKLAKLRCDRCAKPIPPTGPANQGRNNNSGNNLTNEICRYHTQNAERGFYGCCRKSVFSAPNAACCEAPQHSYMANYATFLDRYWLYESTSTLHARNEAGAIRTADTTTNRAPVQQTLPSFPVAVCVDCEFGINKYNHGEIIRISAVEFFSGETLFDHLVAPTTPMKHYNTKYSGIRKGDIDSAVEAGTVLHGREGARSMLMQYVGLGTIIILHGGSSDMSALRLIHPHIIDTVILDQDLNGTIGKRSLKYLAENRLGVSIQANRNGHDSVEDALATRELVWYYLGGC